MLFHINNINMNKCLFRRYFRHFRSFTLCYTAIFAMLLMMRLYTSHAATFRHHDDYDIAEIRQRYCCAYMSMLYLRAPLPSMISASPLMPSPVWNTRHFLRCHAAMS